MQANNSKIISPLFVIGGILFFIITLGFFLQLPWATALWPWEDGHLSYIFIASITAAIAHPWSGSGYRDNSGRRAPGRSIWASHQQAQRSIIYSATQPPDPGAHKKNRPP